MSKPFKELEYCENWNMSNYKDRAAGDDLCCAKLTVEDRPYCAEHLARYYIAQPRKKARRTREIARLPEWRPKTGTTTVDPLMDRLTS